MKGVNGVKKFMVRVTAIRDIAIEGKNLTKDEAEAGVDAYINDHTELDKVAAKITYKAREVKMR